jgi:hypothetical protein
VANTSAATALTLAKMAAKSALRWRLQRRLKRRQFYKTEDWRRRKEVRKNLKQLFFLWTILKLSNIIIFVSLIFFLKVRLIYL